MGELFRLTDDEDGLRLVRELADGLFVEIVEMEGVLRTGGGGLWPWEPDRLNVPLCIDPTPATGKSMKRS